MAVACMQLPFMKSSKRNGACIAAWKVQSREVVSHIKVRDMRAMSQRYQCSKHEINALYQNSGAEDMPRRVHSESNKYCTKYT